MVNVVFFKKLNMKNYFNSSRKIEIFGVKINVLRVDELLNSVIRFTDGFNIGKAAVVSHVNVRGLNFAYELKWYKEFLNRSDIVFIDGIGVILAGRLLGYKISSQNRMTCPDFLDSLLLRCENEGKSIFFLGGSEEVNQKLLKNITGNYKNLKVTGEHGFFEKSGIENESVLEKINVFNPDILYVGFGMPLQEKWIEDNVDNIKSRVILPLGACLDFYTNHSYRASNFLTNNGFEWISRLLSSPKLLWRRYLIGNPLFFIRLLLSKF
jgi:N-acetylglucosaminyldiphosphoundecaprenol N-acetyl-beta-D-mannosaminyltransferase